MCGTCGCSDKATISVEGEHEHVLADGSVVTHSHGPAHSHAGEHAHEHSHSHAHSDAHEHVLPDGRVIRHSHEGGGEPHAAHGERPSDPEARRIAVEQDVMAKNDRAAELNRARFAATGTFVVNLMSSPGSGKTTLLVRTLEALKARGRPLAVIEGDQQTTLDAERIRATGVPAVQVNTGKGCHLDAEMVLRALVKAPAPANGTLFIENVGNLVCPAGFDLGEAKKVVIASVTEGEEKPLKYPDMFAVADLVLINKVDLVSALEFDVGALRHNVARVNPKATVLELSARSGVGFEAWLSWLDGAATARPVVPQRGVEARPA
jgi:hydrogenase nickel incorporation protein HypB